MIKPVISLSGSHAVVRNLLALVFVLGGVISVHSPI